MPNVHHDPAAENGMPGALKHLLFGALVILLMVAALVWTITKSYIPLIPVVVILIAIVGTLVFGPSLLEWGLEKLGEWWNNMDDDKPERPSLLLREIGNHQQMVSNAWTAALTAVAVAIITEQLLMLLVIAMGISILAFMRYWIVKSSVLRSLREYDQEHS